MNREEFLKNIPKLEKVYLIRSGYTKSPFILCDEETFDDKVIAFVDEELAKAEVEKLNQNKNNVSYIELSQDVLASAIASLVLYGVNAISFTDKENTYLYQVNEIVKIPAREDNEHPLFENPSLALTMAYFMQELRKNDENADKEKLKELEEEMLINVMRSKYLLPISKVDENSENQTPSLLIMNTPDGNSLIPIFTDHVEFVRFKKDMELDLKILDFQQMIKMMVPDNTFGYMINPSGVAVIITKAWLNRIKDSMIFTPDNTNKQAEENKENI